MLFYIYIYQFSYVKELIRYCIIHRIVKNSNSIVPTHQVYWEKYLRQLRLVGLGEKVG